MADDPAPALRKELNAALDVLTPQIEGLDDLTQATLSAETIIAINTETHWRRRRIGLILEAIATIDAVAAALDNLGADGYPALPKAVVAGPLFDELQRENTVIETAIGIFEAAPPASEIVATFGEAIPK